MGLTVVAVPDRMTDFVDAFKLNSRTLAALCPGFALAFVVNAAGANRGGLLLVKSAKYSRRGWPWIYFSLRRGSSLATHSASYTSSGGSRR